MVFLDSSDAVLYLSERDEFLENLSLFDRQYSCQTEGEASVEQYLSTLKSGYCLNWEAGEIEHIEEILSSIYPLLKEYRIRLPRKLSVIKTKGAGWGYTRKSALVLSEVFLNNVERPLQDQIVTHELFHIYSRYNKEKRDAMYALIGFRTCLPLTVPAELEGRIMTNPDAPENRWYMESRPGKETSFFIPIMYSKSDYRVDGNLTYFEYLEQGLLEVEIRESETKARYRNGGLTILDVNDISDYGYITGLSLPFADHPEELLAVVFSFMVHNIPYEKRAQGKLKQYFLGGEAD